MARLKIITYGDETLRKKSRIIKTFDKRLQKLIQDMFQTMYEANGIGLAAPQVGLLRRLIVVDTQEEGEKYALVNPKVVWTGEETSTINEGCLSIPGIEGDVIRPESVKVRFNDPETGEETELAASGMLARVLQHEIDHLNGVLFIDHMTEEERAAQSRKLQEMAAA